VFIVDESIRADHLSVNGYERPTTPYLEELAQRGVLHNWGSAVSGATCSRESNNLLLTGITALPDTTQQIQRQPSIFQYAKAMGYTTHYLDSSNPNFWNGTKNDLRFIDHWENATRFADGALYDADMRLAQHTRSVLESTGNVIWINKRGVHFVYNNTFPHAEAQWTPIMNGYAHDLAHREEIRNSYDNGVRYNAETFWRSLITDPAVLKHTVVVYTSDHGQTLAEHGEGWSHCKDTRNEALVPLFLLTDGDYPFDPQYRASHANIFATLLDLMQFPQGERRNSYARSLFGATAAESERRQYFVGPLDGSAGGRFHWFDP
jgi:glucan phosphoethanolaminetransferase (alkaline phosphatase superfamily)